MLTRQEQLLQGEQLTLAANPTWTSKLIPFGQEVGWILVIRVVGTVTGTLPTITPELDATTVGGGGSGMAAVGGAIANITAASTNVYAFATGTTQGAIPAASTFFQVKLTLGGTASVFPAVYIDLIAVQN